MTTPGPAARRVGVLGGGQLARMLALEGHRLGVECVVASDREWACAAPVTPYRSCDLRDPAALREALGDVECVTYEVEHLPAGSVARLGEHLPLRPGVRALEVGQDRLEEKRFLRALGIPVAPFAPVDDPDSLRRAGEELGFPLLLKSRREGYDGRNQWRLDDAAALEARAAAGALEGRVAEGWVDFGRELSLVVVRGLEGELRSYPLVENLHRGGILVETRAPATGVSRALAEEAQAMGRELVESLEYVGVLALELFDTPRGLVANELAPRVHNSGHWSLDGAVTSQFENHLRAVLGLPLGACEARGHAVMVNLIGALPPLERLLDLPAARLHLYGKEPRPARKVGHLTFTGDAPAALAAHARELRALLDGAG